MPTSYGAVVGDSDDAGVAIPAGSDSAVGGVDQLLGPPPPPPALLPPATPGQRFALLTSAILFSSGSHFARHALASLTPTLTSTLTLSATSMAALFSAQELPGIVLPLTAATLLTLGPPSLVAASAAVVSTAGQVAAAAAVGAGSYGWLLAARLAFGAADSVLVVAMGSLIAEGFHPGVVGRGGHPRRRRGLARVSDSGGLNPASPSADGGGGGIGSGGAVGGSNSASGRAGKPLLGVSLAYGLMLLASRGSTFFAMWAPAAIGRACGGDACALWVTAGVSTVSLVGAALYVAVEWDRHRRARRAAATDVEGGPPRPRAAGGGVRAAAARALAGPPPPSSRVSSAAAAAPSPPPDAAARPPPARWAATLLATTRALPPAFWHLAGIWALIASALFPLLHAAGAVFAASFPAAWPAGLSPAAASAVPSVVVGAAAALSPLVGAAVGRRGGRERVLLAACAAMAGGLAVLSVLAALPAPPVGWGGAGEAAGSLSWLSVPAARVVAVAGLLAIVVAFGAAPVTLLSSVAVTVPPHTASAALGIYKAVENVALALVHVIAGALKDWSGSYAPPLAFWAALAAAAAVVAHGLSCLRVPALGAPDDAKLAPLPPPPGGTR
ncbi:hypothetical protein I4F81_004603 [Pyropia yezoensis]|uniref:Uncharacterized protein n=1 Tax=Pyropia yezoensis TaxID=2788 RepID=A0ACC3BVV7_PYRYE|nr:hypothetical protein I4F81_004603 [Neopyropia yezoensis]